MRYKAGDRFIPDDFAQASAEERRLAVQAITAPAMSHPDIPVGLRREPQPDAALLLEMLGLVDPPAQPKPLGKNICPKHHVERRRENSGYMRCPDCRRGKAARPGHGEHL